jgi:hypothetical protein
MVLTSNPSFFSEQQNFLKLMGGESGKGFGE